MIGRIGRSSREALTGAAFRLTRVWLLELASLESRGRPAACAQGRRVLSGVIKRAPPKEIGLRADVVVTCRTEMRLRAPKSLYDKWQAENGRRNRPMGMDDQSWSRLPAAVRRGVSGANRSQRPTRCDRDSTCEKLRAPESRKWLQQRDIIGFQSISCPEQFLRRPKADKLCRSTAKLGSVGSSRFCGGHAASHCGQIGVRCCGLYRIGLLRGLASPEVASTILKAGLTPLAGR